MIKSITWDFENLIRRAPGSDLWPPTWAADGHIYVAWGDGGGFGGQNRDGRVSLGFARIEGDPAGFTGINIWGGKNPENNNSATFGGKVWSMLSVDGVLYAWGAVWPGLDGVNMGGSPENARILWSSDLGKTWEYVTDWQFPEDNFNPFSFVNFGQDYAGARDGYVYILGGPEDGSLDEYLARVPKDQLQSRAAYEFFQGVDASGDPIWTSDITQRQPIFHDPAGDFIGPTVYNPALQRYIAIVKRQTIAQLAIFDAPEPWGPWTMVASYDNWGGFGASRAVSYHFPAKWISADGKTMWMIFSSTGELDSFNLVKATLTLNSDVEPPVASQD